MYFPSGDLDVTISSCSYSIIGTGHITQQLIYMLSKLEAGLIHLIDKDKIEAKNSYSAFFKLRDEGLYKVDKMLDLIIEQAPSNNSIVVAHRNWFQDLIQIPMTNFYISGLDSGNSRIEVFNHLLKNLDEKLVDPYYIDIRANFDFANIYVIRLKDKDSVQFYLESINDLIDSKPNRDCGRYNHPFTVSLVSVAVMRIIDTILKGKQEINMNLITVNSSLMKIAYFPEIELTFEEPISIPELEPIKSDDKPITNLEQNMVLAAINRSDRDTNLAAATNNRRNYVTMQDERFDEDE